MGVIIAVANKIALRKSPMYENRYNAPARSTSPQFNYVPFEANDKQEELCSAWSQSKTGPLLLHRSYQFILDNDNDFLCFTNWALTPASFLLKSNVVKGMQTQRGVGRCWKELKHSS